MNEKKSNRREWIKTAAIIFLSVMLVLTFFSNTIMNYSLPEVAVQYIQSGTITAKVRGTGTVESGSLFNVKVNESRKVMSVAVRVGDTVQIGDVICYLDGSESGELKAAREALKQAQDAYDTALLATDLSPEAIKNAGTESAESYRKKINAAQNEVAAAQKTVDDLQKQYNAFDIQISITPGNNANTAEEQKAFNAAKKTKENAEFALQEATNRLNDITARIEYAESISSGDDLTELKTQQSIAKNDVINAQKAVDDASLAYSKAETALNNKIASGDTTAIINNLRNQQAVIKVNLDAANQTLTEKQQALAKLTGDINAALNLGVLMDAIDTARENVEKLEKDTLGTDVKAEVAGTITSLSIVAGETTAPDMAIATIQPEGKGFTLSFSVTSEQAKRISVGDPAELVNSWWYNDITAKVISIKPDPQDPTKSKLITVSLVGDLVAGQSLSIQIGQKSANYDMLVPNSAIREDNNGKFILVAQAKSSPLGTRYYAVRYDVEVIASDDTQSAIRGALEGYEYVITTSTKPVEAGKLVRLPD